MSIRPANLKPDSFRLPPALREYLKAEAKKNTRSYSGEVAHRLELSRQADLKPTTPKEIVK